MSAVPHFVLAAPRPDQDICQTSVNKCLDEAAKNTKTPKQLFTELFQQANYVFVGEFHPAEDELILIDLVSTFKEIGVKQIAVEMPAGLKYELEEYLKGNPEPSRKNGIIKTRSGARPFYDALEAHTATMPAKMKFLKLALSAGISIIPVDGEHDKSLQERDIEIAKNLKALKGKTLVLFGNLHVAKTQAYPNARAIMDNSGLQTRGLNFESNSHVRAFKKFNAEGYVAAYQKWVEKFGTLNQAIGLYTKQLGNLDQFDKVVGRNTPYPKSLDAVLLLPDSLSPLSDFARRKLGLE